MLAGLSLNPPVALLGACSGQRPMGTVSPYSPCCFQEQLTHWKITPKSCSFLIFFIFIDKLNFLNDLFDVRLKIRTQLAIVSAGGRD